MTWLEHYREAERLVAVATDPNALVGGGPGVVAYRPSEGERDRMVAAAHVHALLAQLYIDPPTVEVPDAGH
jgi:hypothetical protein